VRIAAELIQTPSGANELQQYLRQSLSDETDSLAQVRLQVILAANSREAYDRVLPFLASEDPFLRGAAIECMSHSGRLESLMALSNFEAPAMRVGALLALRRTGKREATQSLRGFLNDADPAVRRAAIQWVAEEHLSEFEPALEDAVDRRPISRQVFEAYVAAKEILAGVTRTPSDEPSGEEFVAKILLDESQSASLRALALRSLRPDHPALQTSQLERWISTGDAGVRNEAVRTLAARPDPASQRLLRDVAANNGTDADIRAQAIAGLGHAGAITDDSVHVLLDLLRSSNPRLRREALRSLRAAASRPDVAEAVRNQLIKQDGFSFAGEREIAESLLRPTKEAVAIDKEWFAAFERSVVEGMSGDPVEGEIIFFHPSGPKCFACHRVNGRGGAVGPDLSAVGSMLDRAKIVRSILDPSKDIAPQFTSWRFALRDGRVMSGILLLDDPRGVITIGDADGKTIEILAADITERKAMDRSIMPDNLAIGLTRGELRDLVSYLMQLR
jgi:putative heme-binding domain-containing protein